MAGRYRIIGRIGTGGMAEVLEAEVHGEAGFVRRVAIKRVLASAGDDPSFMNMFLDEARIASRLHHANIVAVLDYGVVDGSPFQVLELVDGFDARTLLRKAQDGKLPVDIALYLTAQIGHALAAAHEARDAAGAPLGIVHRDVSPANVLVSWDGDVKLADFGIAFAKDRSEKTEAGMTKGTLTFMAPEQRITGRVDARADVFSLGCVLHTLVAGNSPLQGDGFIRFLETRKLALDASLPDDVRDIVEMATRFEPERRFQSAGALTEAVGQALAMRLTREPRRRLVEYLAPLRAARKPPARLDALMRVDMLLASGGPGSREYRTAAVTTAQATQATTVDHQSAETVTAMPTPDASATTVDRTSGRAAMEETLAAPAPVSPPRVELATAPRAMQPGAPSPGPIAIAIAALVVVALGGGAIALAMMARRPDRRADAEGPLASATTSATANASAAGAPVASTSASTEAPSSEPSSTTVALADPSSVPPSNSSRRTAAPKASSPAAHATASSGTVAAPATAACVGALYLSCPAAPRARIEVDGRPSPYHHGDFAELSCAPHTITFRAEDGRQADRAASPSSVHTRTAPLEIRCGLSN